LLAVLQILNAILSKRVSMAIAKIHAAWQVLAVALRSAKCKTINQFASKVHTNFIFAFIIFISNSLEPSSQKQVLSNAALHIFAIFM
jgi:hypothetical protein